MRFDLSQKVLVGIIWAALLHLDPKSPEAQAFNQKGQNNNGDSASPSPSPSGSYPFKEIFVFGFYFLLWDLDLMV